MDEVVKKLHEEFSQLTSDNYYNAMHSRPEYVDFYCEFAEHYSKGASACAQYFENFNVLQFVVELKQLGFFVEVVSLKKYIEDPTILDVIKLAEEELGELQFEVFV